MTNGETDLTREFSLGEEKQNPPLVTEKKGLLARASSKIEDSCKTERKKTPLVDSLVAIDPELAYQVALKESKRACENYIPTELEFSSDWEEQPVEGDFEALKASYNDGKLSIAEARALKPSLTYETEAPEVLKAMRWEPQELDMLLPFFDWDDFAQEWQQHETTQPLEEALTQAKQLLSVWCEEWRDLNGFAPRPCGVFAFFPAGSTADDSLLVFSNDNQQREPLLKIACFRENSKDSQGWCWSVADFIAPMKEAFPDERKGATDWIGFFAVTVGEEIEEILRFYREKKDSQSLFLVELLAKQLAKAASCCLHDLVRREYWGYEKKGFTPQELFAQKQQGGLFLPDTSSLPDPALLRSIFDLISVKARTGIGLLPHYQMKPEGSIVGLYIAHPQSHPLSIRLITDEQLEEYASCLKEEIGIVRKRLAPYC